MQAALNHAYTDPNRNILNIVQQKEVERKGEIPTPEEFIKYAKNKTLEEKVSNYSTKDDS